MITTRTNRLCLHCGTPFSPTTRRPDFCCAGCEFVHGLIAQNGLGQFYDLQEGAVPPVRGAVFDERDWAWLEALAASAEKDPAPHLRLDVQGLTCVACAWLIERIFQRHAGAVSIRVEPGLGTLELRWERGVFQVLGFARELQRFGYLAGPPGKTPAAASRTLIPRLGVCAALAMNTMLFTLPAYLGLQPGEAFAAFFARVAFVLATASLLVGGSYFFARAWRSLRQGVLHMDLPITLGLLAAYGGSVWAWVHHIPGLVYFDFVSVFTCLMLLGRWLQQRTVERHQNQLLASRSEPPAVELEGRSVPANELQPGRRYAVKPGGLVPVRSRLLSEAASVGLEWIHGESAAVTARQGELISSGALNHTRTAVELEALEPWADSLLARLLRMEPASAARHPAVERFIRGYLAVVITLALLGGMAWWWFTGDMARAVQVTISVLVVSCPCASGVALPLVDDLAAASLRPDGVFLRDHALWPRLCAVRQLVLDKTGTLTLEALTLQNPEALDTLWHDEGLALSTLTASSTHPVSAALRAQLLAAGAQPADGAVVRELPGLGVEWEHEGVTWRLGRAAWATGGISPEEGTFFSRNREVVAVFHFGEEPRPGAREELSALSHRGLSIHILSGDHPEKVKKFAARLGLDSGRCHGGLAPDDKAGAVRRIDQHDTLYLGDGANDSLAFDAAWCTGTPACDRGLLEHKAGFYFLGQGLHGITRLLAVARQRRHAVRAVLGFAIAYNACAVAAALAGIMSPLVAAVIMPLSSLVSLGIVALALRRR
jgi:Cu2+-exporting ATPase